MTAASSLASWTNRTGVAATLLPAIHALTVEIETLTTSQLRLPGDAFERITTVVELHGGGHIGRGEDVAYSGDLQRVLPEAYAAMDLAGSWTMASLSEHLDAHPLVRPEGLPPSDDKPGFHRWALESAALDLALRQAGTDLASLIGDTWHPVTVSLSMGLGDPPTTATPAAWLARDASTTFKLDTSQQWTPDLVGQLAKLGAVSTVDFKGLYHGPWIDNTPRPELYATVAQQLDSALIEDANLTPEVRAQLEATGALGRLAWDYPITGPEDVPGLAGSTATFSDVRPGAVNIKPSRFGSCARLLDTIALCDAEGIPCYSGGQYELGIGRTQVQAITSLCFPSAPNDCAPAMFHGATPELADAPLGTVKPSASNGFGWNAPSPALSVDS